MRSLNGDWQERSSEEEQTEEHSSPLNNDIPMRITDCNSSNFSEEHSSDIPSCEESSLEALEIICLSTPCLDPGKEFDFKLYYTNFNFIFYNVIFACFILCYVISFYFIFPSYILLIEFISSFH